MKTNTSVFNLRPLAAAAVLFSTIALSQAEDASGTWTSITEGFGGRARESALILKQGGQALTGSLEGGFGKADIQDGKIDGGAITFKVTRKFGEREFVSDFAGKLEGKAIKGKLKVEGQDGPVEIDWEAYRTPEIDPTGLWKWETEGRGGEKRQSWVKLRYEKGVLSGLYETARSQAAISDAKLEGKTVSFKVVRSFGERSSATSYQGTLDDSGIKGTIKSRRREEDIEREWVAKSDIPKADPIGAWAWTTQWGQDREEVQNKFTISSEEEKLAGSYAGFGGEAKAENVKYEGNTLSFEITLSNDQGEFTSKYSGAVDGDEFEGTISTKFGERNFDMPVTAKRELAPAKPVGTWKWSNRRGRDGEEVETVLTLTKADDGQLAGTLSSRDQESALKDVKLEGNQLSFSTERTFRENAVTIRYSGIVRGDAITGVTRFGAADSSNDEGAWASKWKAKRS